ncbi:MAG: hypothetical protein ACXVCV_16945 [Polyangia bacterium]
MSCICLLGGSVWAQPGSDPAKARAVLRAMELDAAAIRATSLSMDAVALAATKMQKDIEQLPLRLGVESAEVSMIEVAMRAHVAHLVEVANYPDRFLSAGAADDLMGDITRLRNASGLGR